MFSFTLSVLAMAAAGAKTHYGDPNGIFGGCLPDEVKATITGVAGDLCIPPCDTSGKCPQDKPEGASATPGCILTDQGTGQKFCALVCTPAADAKTEIELLFDAQCGKKASCKQAEKDGLCTYDDVPKPPSSEHWVPVDSPTFQAQSVCLAVGFTADGVTGFAGAGSNNVGAQVIKSSDSGKTWVATPAKAEFNIFLNTKTSSATAAVVSGVIEQEHTTDGDKFVGGGPYLCPAQDIGLLPDGEFALVGQCTKGNQIDLSKDGKTYSSHLIPITVLNQTTDLVRYGAFPSKDTWYVAAGTFPDTSSSTAKKTRTGQDRRRVTHRLSVSNEDYVLAEQDTAAADPVNCNVDPHNCFAGAIVKTTDAGKTWTKVWENINTGDNIYNNGIACSSETHCIAAVEGDSARILVTRDGGRSWKTTMNDADPHASLVAVRMLDENEAWVSGGEMTNAFEGRFWHTLDGGDTWTKEAIKGLYIFSFDLVSKASGYAVALTAASGVQLLKYRDGGVGDSNTTMRLQYSD